MKHILVSLLAGAVLVLSPAIATAQQDISAQSSQQASEDSLQQSSQDSLQQSSDETSQQSTEQSSQQTTQQSSEQSTQQTTQDTSQQSSEQTTQATTDNSFQYSTDQTSGSFSATTESSTQASDQSEASSVVVVTIAGAAVAIGLTAVGVSYIVKVSGARQANVLSFQDEIYAADGVEYTKVINTFGIDDAMLVRANDELVVAGYAVDSDYGAAKYLAELVLKIAGGRPLVIEGLGG